MAEQHGVRPQQTGQVPQEALTFERCRAVLERLLTSLRDRLGRDLVVLTLFGSVARGDGRPSSDLDLLIVYRGERQAFLDHFVAAVCAVRNSPEHRVLQAQGFHPDFSPAFYTSEELVRHPWLLLDVLDHGIVLLDRDHLLQDELNRLRHRLQVLGARKVVLPDGTWYWDLKPDWKPGEIVEL